MKTHVEEINGIKVAVRSGRPNDLEVIKEVLVGDCYKLDQLKAKGLNPKFILDVGGHIGSFALKCKSLWPSCRIVAFEPVKENAEMYWMNMRLNNFGDVTVINKGINYDKERTIFVNGTVATGGGMFVRPESVAKSIASGNYKLDENIQFTTFEEALKNIPFDSVDLAKFDCEGGEREAFKQMDEELIRQIGYMVGEFHLMGNEVGKNFAEKYMQRFHHIVTIPAGYMEKHLGLFYAEPK